jgi:hypothetical protein
MHVLLTVGTAIIHHTIIIFSKSDKTYSIQCVLGAGKIIDIDNG